VFSGSGKSTSKENSFPAMQKTGERGEKAGRLLKYQDLTHKSKCM
jgi:hypothetical protein